MLTCAVKVNGFHCCLSCSCLWVCPSPTRVLLLWRPSPMAVPSSTPNSTRQRAARTQTSSRANPPWERWEDEEGGQSFTLRVLFLNMWVFKEAFVFLNLGSLVAGLFSLQLTSQHPYAEVYIGQPHVWTVDIENPAEVEKAIRSILSQKVKHTRWLKEKYDDERFIRPSRLRNIHWQINAIKVLRFTLSFSIYLSIYYWICFFKYLLLFLLDFKGFYKATVQLCYENWKSHKTA